MMLQQTSRVSSVPKNVFSWLRNVLVNCSSFSSAGSLFHACSAAKEKEEKKEHSHIK